MRGLGLWIDGDGQGELLNIQVKSPESLGGRPSEHYIDINFTGKRYISLVEPESDRIVEQRWPYSSWRRDWETKGVNVANVYASLVTWADTGHIETVTLGFINIPRGTPVSCGISPINRFL